MAEWQHVLARVVDERGDALLRYAYLLCGDREDAQDLVQDSLVNVFGRLRNGFSVQSAEAYLRKAILNRYLDLGRSTTRWRRTAPGQWQDDTVDSPEVDTALRLDVRRQLAGLSPRERACVVLRYYEDLKVDDVAEALGISPGSVKRYLSDALGKLGTALASREEDR